MRFLHHVGTTTVLLGVVACADSNTITSPTAVASFNTTSVTEPGTGPWARIVDGKAGPGALYRLYIPRDWNGDAIYYAHGIRDVTSPVDLREDGFSAPRDSLGARGFAVAYSSWSANGLVFKDAAQRVHQMRGILTAELPHPAARSFLVGRSMGGGVALDVLQTYPGQYDGALLMCGMLGGPRPELQYYGDVRVLFDLFYPGVMPGTTILTPPEVPTPTLAQVIAAIQANPTPLYLIASLAQTPLPYRPIGNPLNPSSTASQDLVGSLYTALVAQYEGLEPFYELTHGHLFFDNSTTVYSLGANPLLPASTLEPVVAFANANVARYAADRSAVNFTEHNFTPTGDLRVPVLTLHSKWDPVNPTFHETILFEKALAAGTTQNLLQRLYPVYGHCALPTALQLKNFLDMVDWVTTGVKPAS
jgi:pimeloyl-ACP methyl ester carboxylesterase